MYFCLNNPELMIPCRNNPSIINHLHHHPQQQQPQRHRHHHHRRHHHQMILIHPHFNSTKIKSLLLHHRHLIHLLAKLLLLVLDTLTSCLGTCFSQAGTPD
jgi:hypothetical protein